MSKGQLKIILPILVLLLAGGIYQGLKASKTVRDKPNLEEKVWRIEALQVRREAVAPSLTLYGRVESPELLKAAAPGSSVVEHVYVRNGARVSQGESLIDLDRRDFEASLLQAQADLADVENQIAELEIRYQSNRAALETEKELVNLAEAEVDRLDKLQKQNLSADTALNSARSELGQRKLALLSRELEVNSHPAKLQMLRARGDRANAEMDRAQLAMNRSAVSAPFDAIVSGVEVSAGDRVSPGQILISLFPVNSLEIRAHLPANYIDAVQQAMASDQALYAEATRPGDIRLRLLRLAGEAEATGIDAYFDVAGTETQMRPGELIPLELKLPPLDDVFAVPYQAIYGNNRIYQVVEERLKAIDVISVGQTRSSSGETRVLIRSDDISSGDLIATTHLPNAVAGLKVVVNGR